MITAQTCITNPGNATSFNIYTATTGGPFGIFQTGVPVASLTTNCPYFMVLEPGTTQIQFIDNFGCSVSGNVSSSTVCDNCELGFESLQDPNLPGKIFCGELTGTCEPMTDYRIYWYGPDSTTNVAFTSGFGSAFLPYTYTHPFVPTPPTTYSGITGVTGGTYLPVIDKVKISGITYSQTGFTSAVTTCLECIDSIYVQQCECIAWTTMTGYTSTKSRGEGYIDVNGVQVGVTITGNTNDSNGGLKDLFRPFRLLCCNQPWTGNPFPYNFSAYSMVSQSIRKTTFSTGVTNPVLAVYTLGSDGGAGYSSSACTDIDDSEVATLSADTQYTVYCDEVIPHPCAISGGSYHLDYIDNFSFSGKEGYGMVQFVGTFTSITLNYPITHNYTSIVWGLPCTANTFNP
jgi:hypothetical protein